MSSRKEGRKKKRRRQSVTSQNRITRRKEPANVGAISVPGGRRHFVSTQYSTTKFVQRKGENVLTRYDMRKEN